MKPLAPIIVAAELAPADLAWLDDLRREHFPPEHNRLPAHLTMFHHLPPGAEAELDTRLRRALRGTVRPAATIGEPMLLGRGVALRVRCPGLEAVRQEICEAFTGLLTPQDAAPWRPHVTIQNKAPLQDARRLHAKLEASFGRSRPLDIKGIATFFYRGGPWEPMGRYRFGG